MKKSFFLILSLCVLIGLGFLNSALAWNVEIDNSDGDTTFDFWLRTEGDTIILSSHDVGFLFDDTELTYNGVYTNNLSAGFYEYLAPELQEPGIMYGFVGQASGSAPTISEDYLLGTITMDLLPGATMDGENDVWLPESIADPLPWIAISIFTPGVLSSTTLDAEQMLSGSLGSGLANGSGLDVGASPVPVPAAAWLLGSGLVGLIGIRRKHKN
jgi:hypothetical protein